MAGLIVPQNKQLKDFEPLLNEQRVEVIFYKLIDLVPNEVPDSIEFAAWIQPLTNKTRVEYACFMVKSLHPKQRFVGQELMTIATLPLPRWKQAEQDRWHYAGKKDPAVAIWAGLLRRHLNERKDLTELIG